MTASDGLDHRRSKRFSRSLARGIEVLAGGREPRPEPYRYPVSITN
jgi:hypothetical protein